MPNRAQKLMSYLSWALRHRGSYGGISNPKEQEVYDPKKEQIRAMQQGIYESLVMKELGRKNFLNTKGMRIDVDLELSTKKIKEFVQSAFSFTAGPSKKATKNLLTDDRKPNTVCIDLSFERYQDYDHLIQNRQDYEITLGLARKQGFYRVVPEVTELGVRYFVWPLKPGQATPKGYSVFEQAEEQAAYLNEFHDPRETGKWWKFPSTPYSFSRLREWLPPDSAFFGKRGRS